MRHQLIKVGTVFVVSILGLNTLAGVVSAAPIERLVEDPNYEKIVKSFPNISESHLLNMRTIFRRLNAKAHNSLQSETIQNSRSMNVEKNPKYDLISGTPQTIAEINEPIADFLYQSDIVLTKDQLTDLVSTTRTKRKAIFDPQLKWPTKTQGVIPYMYDAYMTDEKKVVIEAAIKFWEGNACLQFEHIGGGLRNSAVIFMNGSGCYSNIGRIGVDQSISIGDGCEYVNQLYSVCTYKFGIATHEIGHTLGFYHEQSRYDRDEFISISLDNVAFDRWSNFDKATTATMNIFNVPYDYGSVMHYSSEYFARNNTIPVMVATDPRFQRTMGQRRAPSFLDVLTMNRLYGCDELCNASTIVCKNGGYKDSNNCSQCKCPASFGGVLCDQLASAENDACIGAASLTATTAWKSFPGKVGPIWRSDIPSTCYWHLNSPPGTAIEIKLTLHTSICQPGCFWNSVEIKLDENYQSTGIRHCCTSDIPSTAYVSSVILVPIIAYGMIETTFTIDYRYIDTVITTTKLDSTTISMETTPTVITPQPSQAMRTNMYQSLIALFLSAIFCFDL